MKVGAFSATASNGSCEEFVSNYHSLAISILESHMTGLKFNILLKLFTYNINLDTYNTYARARTHTNKQTHNKQTK